jgi:antitoxin component YwqK of YwqJK toxin-antitoxin module
MMYVAQEKPDGSIMKGSVNSDWTYEGDVELYRGEVRVETAQMKKGVLHGLQLIYNYEDGETYVQSKTSYENGKKHGPFTMWYSNGQVFEEFEFSNGIMRGTLKKWYKNGNLQELSDMSEHGYYCGNYEKWYENGQPKVVGQYIYGRSYKNSVDKTGTWMEWHPNGQKKSYTEYNDRGVDTIMEEWYSSGQMKSSYNRFGKVVKYHPNGEIWWSGQNDAKGNRVGTWEFMVYRKDDTIDIVYLESERGDPKDPYHKRLIFCYADSATNHYHIQTKILWINGELRHRFNRKENEVKEYRKETATAEPEIRHVTVHVYKGTSVRKEFLNGKLISISKEERLL